MSQNISSMSLSVAESAVASVPSPSHGIRNDELALRRIRGYLNRISSQKYDTILHGMMQLLTQHCSVDVIEQLVELLLYKAATETIFSALYANLATDLARHLPTETGLADVPLAHKEWSALGISPSSFFLQRVLFLLQHRIMNTPFHPSLIGDESRQRRTCVLGSGCVIFLSNLFKSGAVPERLMQRYVSHFCAVITAMISGVSRIVPLHSVDSEDELPMNSPPEATQSHMPALITLELMCKLLSACGGAMAALPALADDLEECRWLLYRLMAVNSPDEVAAYVPGQTPSFLSIRLQCLVLDLLQLWLRDWRPRRNPPAPHPTASNVKSKRRNKRNGRAQ